MRRPLFAGGMAPTDPLVIKIVNIEGIANRLLQTDLSQVTLLQARDLERVVSKLAEVSVWIKLNRTGKPE